MKPFQILAFLILLCTCVRAQPTFQAGNDPAPEGKRWVPVPELSDEFKGRKVDLNKWQVEPIGNDWGWIGRPPGLFQARNIEVRKGKLRVNVGVLPEAVEIKGNTFTHFGGIVRSLQPARPGYYLEAKMKANRTEMSSTFWLMTKYDCERKMELDVQECVGVVSPDAKEWAREWDYVMHSNFIHRKTECNPEPTQHQGSVPLPTKNADRFYVYAVWWKSPTEMRFYLDGKYIYSITPNVPHDRDAWIHMAIETYDWNPIPADGGVIKDASRKDRRTEYEWVRTWKLE
ncbi:family 16 glycosylhydrolase [Neolewinella agarilytica]|uniref:family 16 glycosylhydrolase n=1 Tax=Neolewinella agarilytica TaxID=478744 RepID=UPI0023570FFB|nr:family 16 glycosylhydrolase [Neolewinella agarilytica]